MRGLMRSRPHCHGLHILMVRVGGEGARERGGLWDASDTTSIGNSRLIPQVSSPPLIAITLTLLLIKENQERQDYGAQDFVFSVIRH